MIRALILCVFLTCSINTMYSTEETAYQVELIEIDSNNFQIVSHFNEAIVTTYFKKTVFNDYLTSITPIRQEFNHLSTGQVFKTRDWEPWSNNTGYWFIYWESFKNHMLYVYIVPTQEGTFQVNYVLKEIYRPYD